MTAAPLRLYVPADPVSAKSIANVEPSSTDVIADDDVKTLSAIKVELSLNVRYDANLSFGSVLVTNIFVTTSCPFDCVVTATYAPEPTSHANVGDTICNEPENAPETGPVNNVPVTVATTSFNVDNVTVDPPSTTATDVDPVIVLADDNDDEALVTTYEPAAGAPFGCNHAVFSSLRTTTVPDVTLNRSSPANDPVGNVGEDGT